MRKRDPECGGGGEEHVANRLVRYLHVTLTDGQEQPACALVRLYKTHPFGELPGSLQTFATNVSRRRSASR